MTEKYYMIFISRWTAWEAWWGARDLSGWPPHSSLQVNIDFDVDVDVDVDVYVDIDVDADIFMLMLVPNFLGAWQQAGNILRIKPFRPWLCETKHTWEGTPDEPEFLEALTQENGEVMHLRILKNILFFSGKALGG